MVAIHSLQYHSPAVYQRVLFVLFFRTTYAYSGSASKLARPHGCRHRRWRRNRKRARNEKCDARNKKDLNGLGNKLIFRLILSRIARYPRTIAFDLSDLFLLIVTESLLVVPVPSPSGGARIGIHFGDFQFEPIKTAGGLSGEFTNVVVQVGPRYGGQRVGIAVLW